MARIPLVDSDDEGTEPVARQVLEQVRAMRGRAVDPNVYRAMANHPQALQSWWSSAPSSTSRTP
jgi:hypothetical protein